MHGGTYNAQCVDDGGDRRHPARLTPALYATIERRGRRLMDGIESALAAAGIEAVVTGFPGIFHVGFGLDAPARNYRDLPGIDRPAYVAFTTALLRRGVRALERGAWFISVEHDDAVIDTTLAAVEDAAARSPRPVIAPSPISMSRRPTREPADAATVLRPDGQAAVPAARRSARRQRPSDRHRRCIDADEFRRVEDRRPGGRVDRNAVALAGLPAQHFRLAGQ